jgi:8-amino-7-oxononanoate synthase
MTTSFHQHSLDTYQDDLTTLKNEGRFRQCRQVEPVLLPSAQEVIIAGQQVVNFSSNDYLGLSQDERLQEAAIEAIKRYGTGSGAARIISGTNALTLELEKQVAEFKQTQSALVFNSGYQANVSILQAILEPDDWVFCDKLNHASLIDGCILSRARWSRYRHLDLEHLVNRLQKAPVHARKWIVTDSVFSMDGDYPNLSVLADIAEQYGALILVDEAHATGLYGNQRSSGLCEQFSLSHRITLQMGTFSKALGGAGAYVAGSQLLMDTLVNKARGFIYSTAQSPAVIGAALKAVEVVQHDTSLKQRLWKNLALLESLIQYTRLAEHIALPLQSPIIPVLIHENQETLRLSQALLDAGYFVQGIRPPSVPAGTSRLRIALSANHTETQIMGLTQALIQNLS